MGDSIFVGGVVSLTTVDYPGCLATAVFFQGCEWRCRYCQNGHLQSLLPTESLPWEDILNLLQVRKGFVEAVVFSGGEPLLQKGLLRAVDDVKKMGFKIGLHTSGADPDRFAKVLPFLNWVGFDIKYSFDRYEEITRIKDSGKIAGKSLDLLIASHVAFEARMTVHEKMKVDIIVAALKNISSLGVKKMVLQKCRDRNENVVEHPIFSDKLTLDELAKCFDSFLVRG
ncbi:MAG: anaerobic ribonucleoside-triphosphate reductase activating protein [Holosporaceae bacterium]|jgi:pyruvate formate lyase activating enzyme|nr:anaerobic ribonucleoside-triphosphate reductase activating protein [Holosporaceae bacterium]